MRLKSIPSSIKKAASFCNDWRDTIFYSCLVAGIIANKIFSLNIPISLFVSYGEVRELCRTLAWVLFPDRNVRYAMSGIFACESMFLARRFAFALTINDPQIVHTINAGFIIVHFTIAAVAFTQVGGFKAIFKNYQKTLFDYPRKIKPPSQSKKVDTKEGLRRFLDRFKSNDARPVPNPT